MANQTDQQIPNRNDSHLPDAGLPPPGISVGGGPASHDAAMPTTSTPAIPAKPGPKITTARQAATIGPGFHAAGGGLYLQVRGTARSWIYRYWSAGKARDMGLGPFPAVTLGEARTRVADIKAARAKGIDPLVERHATTIPPSGMTFREAAERYIAEHTPGWTNPKHAAQWTSSLTTYAFPLIGDKFAREVTPDDVVAILKADDLWIRKTETASRVRGRIEQIIDAANATEVWPNHRNPATWAGNLKHRLPPARKVTRVEHHAALPWRDAPAFMVTLRSCEGVGALALQWTILTAARSMMTRGATWAEMDEAALIWTVPRERVLAFAKEGGAPTKVGSGLKGADELRVPMSKSVMRLLDAIRPLRRPDHGDYLFPGLKLGEGISNATMQAVMTRRGVDVTVHGFRSTFRDWAGEETAHHSDIAEAALAHQLGDKTRQSYQRGDLFAKRARLMADWDAYLAST